MKRIYFFYTLVFILGLFYFLAPSPAYPDLTGGARSDEPGDTWQHPDQKAFFTNITRQEVLEDIQSQFILEVLGQKIPSFRLNYGPEEAQFLVRDQLNSYYLEEIIYPLRESVFINGWEPKNAFKNSKEKKLEESDIGLHGVYYDAKITMKPISSSPLSRVLIWSLVFPCVHLVYLSFKNVT